MKRGALLYISLLFLSFAACDARRDDDLYQINKNNINDVMRFTAIAPDTVAADSFSIASIRIKIANDADSLHRNIVFHTSLGKFTNNDTSNTVFANSSGEATIGLYSSQSGMAEVTATIGTISIDTVIHFIPALPEDLMLTADKYQTDSTDSIQLYTTLFRNRGRISDKTVVYYTIERTDGATGPTPVVPDFAISEYDTAQAELRNVYHVHGTFKVSAYTTSQNGNTIRKSITIHIQ